MKPASPVTVDLYRLAYNAGRPLSLDELVEGMPSAYQNDANRWWVAKEEAAGRIAPPDPWPASMLRSVKAEWVAEQVHTCVHTKRFSVNAVDGRPRRYANSHRDGLVYSANKEKPPMVEEETLVKRMVPWTPEIGATGRRHVAGIKFRDEMARLQALGTGAHGKATKSDMVAALELAMEALSSGSGPSTL